MRGTQQASLSITKFPPCLHSSICSIALNTADSNILHTTALIYRHRSCVRGAHPLQGRVFIYSTSDIPRCVAFLC